MPDDFQKQQQLAQARARDARKKEEARQNIKKYSGAKNRKSRNPFRRRKNSSKEAISRLAALTPLGIFASMLQFSPMIDWTYGIAFFAALLKDILDPFELTGVFYAFVFVITLLASITIMFMMILASLFEGKSNRVERKIIRSFLTLTLATAIEIIPGVNILPIETVTVLVLYAFALQDRKKEEAFEKAEKKIREQESIEQQREQQEETMVRRQEIQAAMAQQAADDYYNQEQEAA